ncbi:hypothetical protein MRX96_004627 [Rhipicephalus microplus]
MGDEEVREGAVSDLVTSRAASKATKRPVFTLVDYEDTKAPGEVASAAGRAFLINEVTRYLQEHMHTIPARAMTGVDHIDQSFLDRSSRILNVCLNNTAPRDLTQWDGIRALLRETNLEDWPYSDTPPVQPHRTFQDRYRA